jgi:hypothetical protein
MSIKRLLDVLLETAEAINKFLESRGN